MEEGIRITNKGKSKKLVTILLIITGILGLALVGVAIYFYAIGDTSKQQQEETKTCACYYIDPSVISECGDPRRAFLFETATVTGDQTCKAACATSKLSTNLLNSTTEQDLYKICQLQTIQDSRCSEMTIKDSSGKIVTGKVSSAEKLTVEAKFDKEYTDYSFSINNESQQPDTISTDKLTIKKSIEDLTNASTINIVATAKDSNGDQINSPICRRLIEVEQEGTSSVTDMTIQTRDVNTTSRKISSIKISVGNLTAEDNLSVIFSFDKQIANLEMTKGLTVNTEKGEIEIVEQDLYNASNFPNSNASFALLDNQEGDISITAQVKKDSLAVGTISRSVTMPSKSSTSEEEEEEEEDETSNLTIAKTSNVTCVERVSPDNVAQFTITTTNKGTTSQDISSITDKLPLGFTYVDSSTKINGVSVTDADYVNKTTVGSSQQIVWKKLTAWTLSANQSITIIFQARAGSTALTGTNKNEAIVTPVQVPTDSTTLRTSYDITVAQDCANPTVTPTEDDETPDTGIFDNVIFKVILGLAILGLGWYIYSKPKGKVIIAKIVETETFKGMEMTTWSIFNPKKYFEEKTIQKISKRK